MKVVTIKIQVVFLKLNKMKLEKTSKRLSRYIYNHELDRDDISDITLSIVDEFVSEGLIPDCTDTENENEFQAQDIIREKLIELFKLQE